VVIVNRLNRGKSFVKTENILTELKSKLKEIQKDLFEKAKKFREDNTFHVYDISELIKVIDNQRGFVKTGWCGTSSCETQVKDKSSATIRVILDQKDGDFKKCAICGKEAQHAVLFAKSY
jgi:prolyl-tRNA synthetase